MKSRICLFLLSCCALFSQEHQPDFSSYTLWDFHPIHVGGNLLRLGSANVQDTPLGGHLFFRKSNVFLYSFLPISTKSYFFPRVDWNTFTLDWNKNPKFSETHFYYMQFALTFYSTAMEKWRWILRADYNLDLEHFNNPSQYGLFSGLAWGAYQLHRKWHYHVGMYGYLGMKGSEYYPVIGFDYSPNKKWTFLAVFPLEYYIQYKIDPHWKFALKGRPLKERFRTNGKQLQPRSIFSYSSIGTELNVHYEIFLRLEAELYGGWNFGGSFYIKNQHGKDALYTNVGGSPYGGLTLNYGF